MIFKNQPRVTMRTHVATTVRPMLSRLPTKFKKAAWELMAWSRTSTRVVQELPTVRLSALVSQMKSCDNRWCTMNKTQVNTSYNSHEACQLVLIIMVTYVPSSRNNSSKQKTYKRTLQTTSTPGKPPVSESKLVEESRTPTTTQVTSLQVT